MPYQPNYQTKNGRYYPWNNYHHFRQTPPQETTEKSLTIQGITKNIIETATEKIKEVFVPMEEQENDVTTASKVIGLVGNGGVANATGNVGFVGNSSAADVISNGLNQTGNGSAVGEGTGIFDEFLSTPRNTIIDAASGSDASQYIGLGHGLAAPEDEHTVVFIWLCGILGALIVIVFVLCVIYTWYRRRGFHDIQAMTLHNEPGRRPDSHHHGQVEAGTKSGVKGARPKDPLVKK